MSARYAALAVVVFAIVAVIAFIATRPPREETEPSEPAPPSPDLLVEEARVAVREAESRHGGDSLEVAATLDRLVFRLFRARRSREDECLEVARRAVDIKTRMLGPEDPGLVRSLSNLAAIHQSHGDIEAARRLYERTIEIRRETTKDVSNLVRSINNYAVLCRDAGDYTRAIDLLDEARERLEGASEETRASELAASVALNRGLILHTLGDLDAALESLEVARSFRERPGHEASLANVHNSIGRVLQDLDRAGEARASFERSLEIWRSFEERKVADEANAKNNLGFLLHELGELDAARGLYAEALDARTRELGAEHPATAWTESNIGLLALDRGDLGAARQHLARALRARRSALGESHVLTSQSKTYLATLALTEGDLARSRTLALEAEGIRRRGLRLLVPYLSERQAVGSKRLEVFGLGVNAQDVAISSLSSAASGGAVEEVWEAVVRSRGVVLDEAIRRASLLRDRADALVLEYARLRGQIANLWLRQEASEHAQSTIRRLVAKRDRIEKKLQRERGGARSALSVERVGGAAVRSALEADAGNIALVSFVVYQRVRPDASQRRAVVPSVGAFVIRPEVEAVFLDLGAEESASRLVREYRESLLAAAFGDSSDKGAIGVRTRERGEALRSRFWDPLVDHLGSSGVVLVVADGPLHLVNLAALPDGGGFLVEGTRLIQQLSTEREVVHLARAMPSTRDQRKQAPLFVAAPDFGPKSEGSRLSFDSLPGALSEVLELRERFQQHSELIGASATEEDVRAAVGSASLVHIATHGYFVDVDTESTRITADELSTALAQSGLALAGANMAHSKADPESDGLLSAEEIGTLDLSSVDWAVLSACGSGLGIVERGEGVFGLRRALRIAGVRTSIMSLWPVGDAATRAWMVELYRARIDAKLSTAASVQEACRSVLRQRRARGESTHPFHWAAFVAVGDWR